MPNYSVSLAQIMIPGGDISEQISTASKEASGTGNMKFMMNGAVTVATMDGANVEIHREVGDDNIIVFGLSSDEVINYNIHGGYNSRDVIGRDPRIIRIIEQLNSSYNGLVPEGEFHQIVHHLVDANDPFYTLADFDSYVKAQNSINGLFSDKNKWNKMAATNIACSGVFSSDNTIKRYADEIWKVDLR